MALIQSGATTDLLTIDPTAKAARTTLRPNEVTGAYRWTAISGTIAAATSAGGTLFTWKYGGTGVAVLRRIDVGLQVTTAYTQGSLRISSYFVRTAFTQGSTGGTVVLLTGNIGKKRTSHPTTTVSAVICASSSVITGDTATGEDTSPFGSTLYTLPAAIGVVAPQTLYQDDPTDHPLVFAQNEGFRIKNDTTFAATGVSTLVVMVEYDEMAAY
jgi:hypothetical protein